MAHKIQSNVVNILAVLKKHKKGIWLNELARQSKVSEGSIYYYIFGQIKLSNGKFYGGDLKDSVITERKGRNIEIKLKNI